MTNPFKLIGTALAFAVGLASASPARAQDAAAYPEQPVTIVVPFAPGGGADNLGRLIAPLLSERLGQEFIIENREGGGSAVGSVNVVNSDPDGYTYVLQSSSAAINLALYGDLPYDLFEDLKPVSLLASGPVVLVAHPSTNLASLDDLLAQAREAPNTINFATGGNGSPPHLALELMMNVTDTRFVPVHYSGAGPATTDVLGGHVGMMFSGVSQSREHIEAGSLVALAITGDERSPALPDVPTIGELGYPDVTAAGTYWGLLAPADTPDDIVSKVSGTIAEIMKDPALVERLNDLGYVPIGSTPEEHAAHVRDEADRWMTVVKAAGIKAE